MSDELAKLRADLEAINRVENIMAPFSYEYGKEFYDKREKIRDEIARLEAEAADPWRGVATIIRSWATSTSDPTRQEVAKYVDHLTAERDRLAARGAELEAANEPPFWPSESEIQAIQPQDEKAIMDAAVELMEGLGGNLDPDDPILDPARVLKTAVRILKSRGDGWIAASIDECFSAAKPYRLKGGKNGS